MFVKSVELRFLKGFEHLSFSFDRSDGSYAGWTVVVGGNASGKSTLLKAIALTLLGPDDARLLMGPIHSWIRNGVTVARSRLSLDWSKGDDSWKKGGKQPAPPFNIGLDWWRSLTSLRTRSSPPDSAQRGPWNDQASGWFSAGYGPMRRLSGNSNESLRLSVGETAPSRFVTLFREDAALSESEQWLRTMHSRVLETKNPEQKLLLDGVTKLLSDDLLPHAMRISRITVDDVFVMDMRGVELPMREISDGCRNVYAMILDLVHNMALTYGVEKLFGTEDGHVFVDRPGVVLIDEVEAHLHPSWQRKLPEWLKVHFPKIQFIVTTHSPLIAQAADENSIFALPLQDDHDRKPRQLTTAETERIRLGRAEKTLLGSAFGLSSSRTIWANQQIREWQKLDAKHRAKVRLTAAESKKYSHIQKILEFDTETDGEDE